MDYQTSSGKLKEGLARGISKGWKGFVWMMEIIIPVSFLTSLLEWSGWMEQIDFVIQPVMGVLSLPGVAALPLLIGMLTGIYGGIASMAVLPFNTGQMTLIAVFLLIAHNLIMEGIVQGKSGMGITKATLFRLFSAVVVVLIIAPFIDTTGEGSAGVAMAVTHTGQTFLDMLSQWCHLMWGLVIKIFIIIMSVLTMVEILKIFGWINHIVRFISPCLSFMGLSRGVGILWITAIMFGLAYGGAVIVEEAKKGNLKDEELEKLHLSIGINHAVIEDPLMFLPFGISLFWLWIPRLVMAMVAVRMLSLWRGFAGPKKY